MARLLLVEDDDYLRDAIRISLEERNHLVIQAPNGRVAREILGTQQFDVIISDIQMPFLNGVELLEWVKVNGNTPVILMTGFSNLLQTQSAYEMGAKEFLLKPFKDAELIKAVDSIIGRPDAAKENEKEEPEYCKVSIDEFVARPKIDFDVFVKLSDQKYIKIGHSGSELPKEQIQKYKDHKLKHLHIRREDFGKLVQFNLEMGKILKATRQVPKEKKVNFMKYTGEVILEKAFVDGVDKESFDEARDFMGLAVSTMVEDGDFFDLLGLLNNHGDYIYAHSVGVAMYSIMIARRLGMESNQTFYKLSMAGLFHDIGKKEIEREILEKPRPLLSLDERKMIESHPVRGRDILLAIPGVPSDVVQLVYEHHEDAAGQGFPRAIKRMEMHPLSKVIQTANLFVENAVPGPHNKGRSAKSAIEHLKTIYLDRMDENCLKALESIFK